MSSSVAFFVYSVGIGGLFFLDRDRSTRTSKALWLPVIWLWINGSRPLSAWLGMGVAQSEGAGQLPSSSDLDQLVAGILMLLGIIALAHRRKDVNFVFRANWPIVLYFSFCLVSVLWSDFSGWGLKRLIRALGDLLMVMVIVTDAQPTAAVRRFLSRVGFVLLPTSLLLIKYYHDLGQAYDQWGLQTNVGVTTNKNILGVVTFVITLGTLWQVLWLLLDRNQPNRARRLLAQCTLLCFGLELLFAAHSATSGASFALGAGLMLATVLPMARHRPAAVHALVLVILLVGGLIVLLGGEADAAKAIGRTPDLTGRTIVWKAVIPLVPSPIVGAGFESFWLGPRAEALRRVLGFVNEAHNGYLEVYLNLGGLGVGLIALILGQGYRAAVGAFRRDPIMGGLVVAYIVTAATYNISEAGFRMLSPSWFFLLLAVVAAGRATSVKKARSHSRQALTDQPSWWDDCDTLNVVPNLR